jgi:hypothetical protein
MAPKIMVRNKYGMLSSYFLLAISAGMFYFLLTFSIGFVLGVPRTLFIEPHIGVTAAVSIEAPLMIVASWNICNFVIYKLQVPSTRMMRSLIGIVAFIMLMFAEFALSNVLGRSIIEHARLLLTIPGLIGLTAQVLFALFPLFV